MSNADNTSQVAPASANGDVGPNHYVQQTNQMVRVFDKSGVALTIPFKLGSLWQLSVGGPCALQGQGSPIVMYDQLADRWILSQVAFDAATFAPPYYECIAVSQTANPTGAYYLYSFAMPGNNLPDNPKLGVWPDAYYMSSNQLLNGLNPNGVGAFALDRARMLAGDPTASMVYFNLPGFRPTLPSDLDGLTPPPAGAPNVFAFFTANEFGGGQVDGLRLFNFHVDFANPVNSSFIERAGPQLTVTAFNPLTPSGRDHIEQPAPANNTTHLLDSVSDRLMHRLAYRNFGTHQSLVVTHTVNVGTGTSIALHQAGIRYYELRKTGAATFSVADQGTFNPDSANRWMGSAAMDYLGNLAVGYSVSSRSPLVIFPSIRYAGRLATDAPGGLFQGETTLFAGTGAQLSTGSRWGDYSSLSVDPVDDCTFWYTNEYYAVSSTLGWRTRVASFRFPTCTTPSPRGAINGLVTNASTGQPIPGAVVTTTNGFWRSTSGVGQYAMDVAPGDYDMTAAALGYMPASGTANATAGNTATANFALVPLPIVVANGAALDEQQSCNLNGGLDRGEKITAHFTLTNVGPGSATELVASLQATGGVIEPSGPQSYGVLAAFNGTTSRPFTFTVAAACGSIVTATLHLQDGATDLGTVAFSFPVGTPEAVGSSALYSSGNLNVTIDDTALIPALIPITVPDLGILDDVNVRVRLSHTFDADLTIELIAPDGTIVTLADGNGVDGDNFGSSPANCTGVPTVFDDAAPTSITTGTAPLAGSFKPVKPLSALNGKRTEGIWRIRVTDNFPFSDQGTVHCVQLEMNRRLIVCCTLDTDTDGASNDADADDDNDLVLDVNDAFPFDPTEHADADADGVGDNADPDDDNDGALDAADAFPFDPNEQLDTDGDAISNNADTNDDGDAALDVDDAFPLDPTETIDTDGDGIGNNADTNDDGDAALDVADAFPLDPSETTDTDGDGIGNNADANDDNDGLPDADDPFPLEAGLRSPKQAVVSSLTALLPSASASQARALTRALVHLTNSLSAELWADDLRLTRLGQRVFNQERLAVHALEQVQPAMAGTGAAIAKLLVIDRGLATQAIVDATGSGDARLIASAILERGKGDAMAALGRNERAIGHYRQAWLLAMRAARRAPELFTAATDLHAAIASLTAILPTGNRDDDTSIRKAIADIQSALAANLWGDAAHLSSRGERVFNELSNALDSLQKGRSGGSDVFAQENALTSVARALAETAIVEADAAGGRLQDLARARDALERGDEDTDASRGRNAIDFYRQAWSLALKSVS